MVLPIALHRRTALLSRPSPSVSSGDVCGYFKVGGISQCGFRSLRHWCVPQCDQRSTDLSVGTQFVLHDRNAAVAQLDIAPVVLKTTGPSREQSPPQITPRITNNDV